MSNQIPEDIRYLFQAYPEYRLVETSTKGVKQLEIDYAGGIWPLAHPLDIDLLAYRTNWNGNSYDHLKKAHDILWPDFGKTWHYWTEQRFREHCDNLDRPCTISWAGGGSIGKSMDAAKLGFLFWLSNPSQRAVMAASTTLHGLDRRVWGRLKLIYKKRAAIQNLPGVIDNSSPPRILIDKDDTIHGIFAVPAKEGSDEKAIQELIGHHPDEGLMVILDEAPDLTLGLMGGFANWEKHAVFQCIAIGNSRSRDDLHGQLSRPKAGWDTINPDDNKRWETEKGVCLYFDCYDSPAIHEPDPIKKQALGVFLFTQKNIDDDLAQYGEDSPYFWRMKRGFWCPEGTDKTVLSQLLIDKHDAQETPVTWSGTHELIHLASLDPAFTADGDSIVFRHAKLGVDVNGRWMLDFLGEEGVETFRINVRDTNPVDYQILDQLVDRCRELGIPPENVGVDVTGTGMGLASIIKKEWKDEHGESIGHRCHFVENGGRPSELPLEVSPDGKIGDAKTARDQYDRKVTELWFMIKHFILSEQIRGLDDKACEQFCKRRYDWKGHKISIEKKSEYRERQGRKELHQVSPDEADCAVILVDMARHKFGFVPDIRNIPEKKSALRKYLDYKSVDAPAEYVDMINSARVLGEREGSYDNFGVHPSQWNDGFLSSEFSNDENSD